MLKPETISLMLQSQPNVPQSTGLGYGFVRARQKFLAHSGANPGWCAFFLISAGRRDGFVIANNSSRAGPSTTPWPSFGPSMSRNRSLNENSTSQAKLCSDEV
jgi:hypothetical protein